MDCPHLRYRFLFVCVSEGLPYIPEIGHIREFCRGARHDACPFCTGKLKKLRPAGHPAKPAVSMTDASM